MGTTTIKYFGNGRLPLKLQAAAKPVDSLAHALESLLPDGPEKSAGMRKLLEARECFIRSMHEMPDLTEASLAPAKADASDLMVIFRSSGLRSKEDPLGMALHDQAIPLARFNARQHLADGEPNQKLSVMTRAELDEKYPHMSRI